MTLEAQEALKKRQKRTNLYMKQEIKAYSVFQKQHINIKNSPVV